jgi:hypothetical protein
MSKKLSGLRQSDVIGMLSGFKFELERTQVQTLDDWIEPESSCVLESVVSPSLVPIYYEQYLSLTFGCSVRVPHNEPRLSDEAKLYLSKTIHRSLYGEVEDALENLQYLIGAGDKNTALLAITKLRDSLSLRFTC